MVALVIVGSGLLVGLALIVGLLSDREARRAAWTRISVARRVNAECRRGLDEREIALDVGRERLAARERRLDQRELVLVEHERLVFEIETELGLRSQRGGRVVGSTTAGLAKHPARG